jgi:L-fucose isomerase-like protein
MSTKSRLAVFLGSRGNFPGALIASARAELETLLQARGHAPLFLDAAATRNGAVDTPEDGAVFARFLQQHRGAYDGVILCLPNFGSEGGVIAGLRDVDVPVWVHAYPDELEKLDTARRRDAFCGKFAMMNVLRQAGVCFTAQEPHVCSPGTPVYLGNLDHFDRVCRVVKAMRRSVIGAVGARTTPFKAVRFDEIALQAHGLSVETLDLSDVFARYEKTDASSAAVRAKQERLAAYTCWGRAPAEALVRLARLGVVLDTLVTEYGMDAMALRCWVELQQRLGVSPCVLVSEMNDRGIPVSCEVDVCSAVAMRALQAAAGTPATCLDWNNNYGDAPDKCILFHCGPVPRTLMRTAGEVADHDLLVPMLGPGCSWGCVVGRIRPMPVTYAGMQTIGGKLAFYMGEGRFTEDEVPPAFFGCAGVLEVPGLQGVLRTIGAAGHRHHTNLVEGHLAAPVAEALAHYVGCEVLRV